MMEPWDILKCYFESSNYFITKHHLESYNEFVTSTIPNVIASMNPFPIIKYDDNKDVRHKIEVYIGGEDGTELFFNKPTVYDEGESRLMFPNECRLKNWTYSCELRANVIIRYTTGTTTVEDVIIRNVFLCNIPIMLHSKLCILTDQPFDVRREMGECPYDQGGYFVVDGKEKCIVAQEYNVTNRVFVNKSSDDKYFYQAFIRCKAEKTSVFPKTIWFYVLSDQHAKAKRENTILEGKFGMRKNAIVVKIPHIEYQIPLFMLFRALGVETDKEIISYILGDLDDQDEMSSEKKLMLNFIRDSVVDGSYLYSQTQVLTFLANFVDFKSVDHIRYVLLENLFPNVAANNRDKAVFLGYVVADIVKTSLGLQKETDRDNYMHKRVGISGFLLGDIFKDFYNDFRVKTRTKIDNMYEFSGGEGRDTQIKELITALNINDVFNKSEEFRNGMIKSLKGTWGLTHDSTKQGIVQDLNRISYMGFLSHLRRVNTPMDTSIKIRAPHQLNGSQWGIMCPCESPDGASIGLLKNLAILCHISFKMDSDYIYDALEPFEFKKLTFMDQKDMSTMTKLKINNNLVGGIKDPVNVVRFLRLLRRNGLISLFISVSWNVIDNEINVLCDSGRCCRPLLVVDRNNKLRIHEKYKAIDGVSWNKLICGRDEVLSSYVNAFEYYKLDKKTQLKELMSKLEKNAGVIEFVDVEEANTCLICPSVDDLLASVSSATYTHCEIHPSTMLSVYTVTIPFSNHNQAPRNIFSGAQGKQAIGVYATNFNNRIDTMSYVLHYPQKPLVNTRYSEYINANDLPNGENVIVAISTFTGYNQEDSIIINKSAIERGLFNLSYFKSYISSETVVKGGAGSRNEEKIYFANPNTLKSQNVDINITKYADYSKIDENGMPIVGSYIEQDDVIIGKCANKVQYVPIGDSDNDIFKREAKKTVYESRCEIADKTVSGFVDKVVVFKNKDGMNEAKVRLRKVRIPELGDKLASRHGQKGVIGCILPHDVMPFTKEGLVPDIIVNPHAFPSRMTIGHLIECLLAKTGTYMGCTIDGTPFGDQDFFKISDMLESKYKMDKHGDEVMYNGITGDQMTCEVFVGPTYYFRLKHMVADKINYRLQGKVVGITKQPTKGRGNNGGLRIGEMESNVIISHGLASFMKESMMERSDKYTMFVSGKTGSIATYNKKKRIVPPANENVRKVSLPYAFKLFMQEMQTMAVDPVLLFDRREEDEDYTEWFDPDTIDQEIEDM